MIIRSLHIDKFGKWSGLRLQNLDAGVNLFYGPNETGKTTLMQFLRTIFYGFSPERLAYVYKNDPEKTGGDVQVQTSLGELCVARHLVPLPVSLPESSQTGGLENSQRSQRSQNSQRSQRSNVAADLTGGNAVQFSELPSGDENPELPFFVRKSFQNQYCSRTLDDGLVVTDLSGVRQDSFQWRGLLELAGGSFSAASPFASVESSSGSVNLQSSGDLPANSVFKRSGYSALSMDETLFNNIFALGLQELQRLSVLDSTEASKRLYDLSTGVARYSIVSILAELMRRRQRILSQDALPKPLKTEDLQWCDELSTSFLANENRFGQNRIPEDLSSLLNYRQILSRQISNIQLQNKQYGKIHSERVALCEKIKGLEESIQQQKHRSRIFEIALNVQSVWSQRAAVDGEIVEFGASNPDLTEVADSVIESTAGNRRKIQKFRQELSELKEERSKMQAQLSELKERRSGILLNQELLQKVPVLETFFQQQEWIETLRGRLDDLRRQQVDSEAQLSIDYDRLGLSVPDFAQSISPENAFPFDVRTLRPLRTPGREMSQIRKQIQTVQKRRGELLREAGENALKIGAYYRACQERLERAPEMRTLPGLSQFPEMFLVRNLKNDEAELSPDSKEGRTKALNTLNSRIVQEIPDEILSQTGSSVKKRSQNDSVSAASSVQGMKSASTLEPEPHSPSAGLMDVNAASRLLGEVLSGLRRSEIHLQQLEQTLKVLSELKKESQTVVQKRFLSTHELYLLGGAFSLGLALMFFEILRLTGILHSDSSPFWHFFLFLLSSSACLGIVWGRLTFLKKNAQKQIELEESLNSANQQRERLTRLFFTSHEDEVAALEDSSLKMRCEQEARQLQTRIGFIEKELTEAETAGTSVSRRVALLMEAKHLTARCRKLKQGFAQAKARRQGVLRSLGLPESWKSANIRQLLDASDRIRELWRRRGRDLEDLKLYSQELAHLVERLQKLLPTFGEETAKALRGGDERFPFVPAVFATMQKCVAEEQEKALRAGNLDEKIASVREQLRKLRGTFLKKSQEQAQILEAEHVTNEKALREKLENLTVLKNLRTRRRELQKQIDGAVEFACTESMLWEVYDKNSVEQITEKKKILDNALAENEFQLESAQKRETECRTILEKIISDDSPTRIQYEIQRVDALMGHTVNAWRVFALTQRLVETVQKTYQQKRQPRTLECASVYLREMTEGKYERVWTPVDENMLFVQRADGVPFSTDQLSSGTRELLYLAIRLALIEEYRLRNVHLPLILDDVLVNFDRSRATAAAKVLTRFAGDKTQIFFFTSHEHIRDIFATENALICNMEKR